ncbi:ComF family protein [Streptomyces sp. NPDC050803]|uniref:ComF family protein n=1 Tax=unclassified Streptomyces TaxID=2593676 RepID=UPI003441984E
MRGWWQDLTDLVLPAECEGCGRPRTVLCAECRTALSGAAPGRVRPVTEPPGLPVVHAAARYADEVRAVLLAHKERGALALAAPLGAALAGAVRAGLRVGLPEGLQPGGEAGRGLNGAWQGAATGAAGGRSAGSAGPVLLVPVPSARRAVRARGHDPVRRIALAAAGELRRAGTPARVVDVLRQQRAVVDQSVLNSRQRLDNLAGALAVAPGGAGLLRGGPVVLVDDLMTTGASLAEAARAVGAATVQERGPYDRAARSGAYDGVTTAVCGTAAREGTGERRAGVMADAGRGTHGPPGMAGAVHAGEVICAAVVAASPGSFEINRN